MSENFIDRPRHIVICNERILFRFGVDRVLVETARMFASKGWRITFVCLRCELEVVSSITPHLFIPTVKTGANLYEVESGCEQFLEENWDDITVNQPVDAIITGGWPFFNVGRFGKRHEIATVFIDAGAVPHDGMDENQRSIQTAVRRVRRTSLPHYDEI